MTADEQIKRITGLLNELGLNEMSYEEYEREFMNTSVNDIKDELGMFYCFAVDVRYILNNGGK